MNTGWTARCDELLIERILYRSTDTSYLKLLVTPKKGVDVPYPVGAVRNLKHPTE